MVITLQELEIHNIFQIKNAKIKFDSYGLSVIYGLRDGVPTSSNGTGKSSILEALDWLLFDRTNKGIAANDILRRGSKNGFARLMFNVGDTRYEITKRRGKHNDITLVENGKDISYKDQDTTKGRIRKILPISYELWSSIISIGQGKSGLLFEGTDKERKDIFIDLLSLDILDKALERVRERKNKANDAMTYHSGKLSSLKIMEDDTINDSELLMKLKRKKVTLDNSKEALILKRLDALIRLFIEMNKPEGKKEFNEATAARILKSVNLTPTEIARILGKKSATDVSTYLYPKKKPE